jgi:nickel-type superoxide dismutase maturation protease
VLPLTRVRIVGPSMEPAVRNDEWWLVRRTDVLTAGDLALIVHPSRPHALIVKRLARREGSGWWVLGDNPEQSEDSRQFGVVPVGNVVGRLVWRYRPLRRPAE